MKWYEKALGFALLVAVTVLIIFVYTFAFILLFGILCPMYFFWRCYRWMTDFVKRLE